MWTKWGSDRKKIDFFSGQFFVLPQYTSVIDNYDKIQPDSLNPGFAHPVVFLTHERLKTHRDGQIGVIRNQNLQDLVAVSVCSQSLASQS